MKPQKPTPNQAQKFAAGAAVGTATGLITKNPGTTHAARGLAGIGQQAGQAAGANIATGGGVASAAIAGGVAAKGAVIATATAAAPVLIPVAFVVAIFGLASLFQDNETDK